MSFYCRLLFPLFLAPFVVLAQGASYFEFAPKISEPLDIDDYSGSVYELLLPQNDHLSGFDIWYDNSGSPGSVSFGLRKDGFSNLLAAKTVAVSAVAPSFEGTRIHVDFGSAIPTDDSAVYSIKIFSETPDFRLYQADRLSILLQHATPYTSPYVNGVVRVDSDDGSDEAGEQEFSFKFALYETQENLPPIVTNATTTIISLNELRFSFNVNEPADFRIQYSPVGGGIVQETSLTGQYQLCSQGAAPCLISLSVAPDATYNYILYIRDEWGNETQLSGSFAASASPVGAPLPSEDLSAPPAPEAPDTTPPNISELALISVTQKSAKLTWTTNEVANTTLRVTEDEAGALGAVAFVTDPVFELVHTITSPAALNASTTYYAHISSTDLSNNTANGVLSFKTLPEDPAAATVEATSENGAAATDSNGDLANSPAADGISSATVPILPPPLVEFSSGETTAENGLVFGKGAVSFQWSLPAAGEPEDGYRIDVFDGKNNLVKQLSVGPGEDRSVKIRGLKPGRYTIIIYSNRRGIFERIAQPTEIVILEKTLFEKIIQYWYAYILIISAIVIGPWYLIRRERARLKKVTE